MTYLPQRIAVLLSRVLGWFTMVFLLISAVAAIPNGSGPVAATGALALAYCPGAVLAFGSKSAFEGDRFWHRVLTIVYVALCVGFAALGFITGSGWLVLVFPFVVIPPVILLSTVRPGESGDFNARRYLLIGGVLFAIWFASAWLVELLG